jgi:hypothetical protein
MKIVTQIRQMLKAKPAYRAPNVTAAPLRAIVLPQLRTSPEVDPPATASPPQLPSVSITKHVVHLEGEGIAEAIPDPSTIIIRRELERLRTSGPSFLALVSASGSYLQAAGNARRMTVEGHVVRERDTAHVVLGRHGPLGSHVTVGFSEGSIDVRACEVWSAPEVAQLFGAFAATGSIPPNLRSRDITAELESS